MKRSNETPAHAATDDGDSNPTPGPRPGAPGREARLWIHRDGKCTLARFDHDTRRQRGNSILYLSAAGTEQSRSYKRELSSLLYHAGQRGLVLKRVAVESKTTTDLPLDTRTLKLKEKDVASGALLPRGAVALGELDTDQADALRKRIGSLAAAVGRPKGAKGGGNTHKTLRLYFDRDLQEQDLVALASGDGSRETK